MADELDRRAMLEEALEQAEEGTLEAPEEKEIEVNDDPIEAENNEEPTQENTAQEEPDRDEKGRFKAKSEQNNTQADTAEESEPMAEVPAVAEEIKRPTTWKKEYVEIWDKMEKGEQLSKEDFVKFAEYANQREAEYKRGVSAYKAEADNARQLTEAIGPFIPELQKHGIHPVTWIQSLGRAHYTLANGTYEQKLQAFNRLAQDYGIQLNQEGVAPAQQPAQDPYAQQLMQQLQYMNQEVSTIKSRYEQEEQTRLNNEIESFKSSGQAPHFEMVREQMAQLLERGLASDLKSAYEKAVRLNDEVWALEQDQLLKTAAQQASKAKQVAKAKATAVSPRSVTPNGKMTTVEATDRRSLIAKQLGEVMSDRV